MTQPVEKAYVFGVSLMPTVEITHVAFATYPSIVTLDRDVM
jgi:hypothetical protein